MAEKIRILFLAANPKNSTILRLDEEIREIQSRIRAAEFRESFELLSRWAVRPRDLLQALNEVNPHIVHISGHGSASSELKLEDDDGLAKPVTGAALTALFKAVGREIRLVVLNACHSEDLARTFSNGIDCSVGMNAAIGDTAAIIFASAFYGALAFGRSVGEGFEQGRVALMLEGIREEDTPILLCRPGIDAAAVSLLHRRSINRIVPPLALKIVAAAASSNSPINVVRNDNGLVVLAGSAQFDSQGDQRQAALFDDAIKILVQVNWIQQIEKELFSITRAGFEAVDQGRDAVLSSLAEQMAKLFAEMKQDLEREKFVREFYVLEKKTHVLGGSAKQRFIYYEEEHDNLRGQLDMLENQGYLIDVTTGNSPIYRMTEEFVRFILQWV